MNDSPTPEESQAEMVDAVTEALAKEDPQDFVVVMAYRSTDGEIEEEFGKMVEDIKMLHTFKQDVRVYALIERAAAEVLAIVEKPKESSGG